MKTAEEEGAAVALGIDIGTSGARAAAITATGHCVAMASAPFATAAARRDPAAWWQAVETCLVKLRTRDCLAHIKGVAIDGTSGTMLAIDAGGGLVSPPLMYNDPCPNMEIVEAINRTAPAESPARGANSALARAIFLSRQPGAVGVVHQADWIALKFGLAVATSDENNALKTGYDTQARCWPDWLDAAGMDPKMLPAVKAAGTPLDRLGKRAASFGLPDACRLHAGTTDGCASFLATGAHEIGDAVTALGSTIVLKLVCDRAISAPDYGVYSHRIGDVWLAGGASNTGGAVIRALLGDDDHLAELTARMDPDRPTGLDYYPLARPGERFPVSDPDYPPRLTPRPDDEALFFQGILEGMTRIEKTGYDRLQALGAPALRSVRTVGGGTKNPVWTQMRRQALGAPFLPPRSAEAAVGAATLVLDSRRAML